MNGITHNLTLSVEPAVKFAASIEKAFRKQRHFNHIMTIRGAFFGAFMVATVHRVLEDEKKIDELTAEVEALKNNGENVM